MQSDKRDQIIEECAMVVDNHADTFQRNIEKPGNEIDRSFEAMVRCCGYIAPAIRALKSAAPAETVGRGGEAIGRAINNLGLDDLDDELIEQDVHRMEAKLAADRAAIREALEKASNWIARCDDATDAMLPDKSDVVEQLTAALALLGER
jgi:hypothetical protein